MNQMVVLMRKLNDNFKKLSIQPVESAKTKVILIPISLYNNY